MVSFFYVKRAKGEINYSVLILNLKMLLLLYDWLITFFLLITLRLY